MKLMIIGLFVLGIGVWGYITLVYETQTIWLCNIAERYCAEIPKHTIDKGSHGCWQNTQKEFCPPDWKIYEKTYITSQLKKGCATKFGGTLTQANDHILVCEGGLEGPYVFDLTKNGWHPASTSTE